MKNEDKGEEHDHGPERMMTFLQAWNWGGFDFRVHESDRLHRVIYRFAGRLQVLTHASPTHAMCQCLMRWLGFDTRATMTNRAGSFNSE